MKLFESCSHLLAGVCFLDGIEANQWVVQQGFAREDAVSGPGRAVPP